MGWNTPDDCPWSSDMDYYDSKRGPMDREERDEDKKMDSDFEWDDSAPAILKPIKTGPDTWTVYEDFGGEDEDREPAHRLGCVCADCNDAELTVEND